MSCVSIPGRTKIERAKLLLQYGRSCDSCHYYDKSCMYPSDCDPHNSRGDIKFGPDGVVIPFSRICEKWLLSEMIW